MMSTPISQLRYRHIHARVVAAAQRVGRDPASIICIAVSKTQPTDAIMDIVSLGHTAFGENYVQELLQKQEALAAHPLTWHFLGHLQRNKVRQIVARVEWLHSLDSVRLAEAIQQHTTWPLRCFIEVNVGNEPSKHGIPPSEVHTLIEQVAHYPRVQIRGLMCIPPANNDPEASRPYYRQVASLMAQLNAEGAYPMPLHELSMGMSHDFEVAIEEGATMVRVGTALFGPRA